jgi:hypothetical protein
MIKYIIMGKSLLPTGDPEDNKKTCPLRSVCRGGCSQAGKDILAQNTAVLRYATHFILKKRAQKNASFPGIGVYVLAHLQVG